MRIGIDIDGCLTNEDDYRLAYVYKYCLEKGIQRPDEPYWYEYKASFWNNELEEDYRKYYHENYMKHIEPRYGAKEVLAKLQEEGHTIILITGRYPGFEDSERGKRCRDITEEWLRVNEIPHDSLVFTSFPKIQYICDQRVDIMVEDFDETLKDCVKHFPTFCYDNRYNMGLELENMTRFYSWYDFYGLFHQMYDTK